MTGSVGHVVALVHNRFLAERGPHPSASQPPSPSGKALPTQYKLEGLYLSMINDAAQSLPLGGRWAGHQPGSDEGDLPSGIGRVLS